MKFLIRGAVGALIVQILVAWAVLDEVIHGGTLEKGLPSPGVWLALSLLGGALIGLRRSTDTGAPSGCARGFAFSFVVLPACLILGFVREVIGVHSEPEGFWIKATHVLFHAFFFAAAAFLVTRPKRRNAA